MDIQAEIDRQIAVIEQEVQRLRGLRATQLMQQAAHEAEARTRYIPQSCTACGCDLAKHDAGWCYGCKVGAQCDHRVPVAPTEGA